MTNRTIILSSPNQKIVVTKKTLSDTEHTYSRANIEATLLAASALSDKAFKLYVRMNLHQNDFTYALSPMAIKVEVGMSVGKYRSAVQELMRKGYLVLAPERKNLFLFYEYPQKDCTGFIVGEPNANTADHGAETEDHGTYLTGHAEKTAISSTENEEMGIQVQHGNPTDPSIEISQDITEDTQTHNERDTPMNTTEDIIEDTKQNISLSYEQKWQLLAEKRKRERQLEQERRDYEAIISSVDPDDRHFFDHMNPDRNLSYETDDDTFDWDDPGLPF